MPALLIDTSHHNPLPSFRTLEAGGVNGVIAKASEGTAFADPAFAAARAGTHAAGMLFGAYHFTDLGPAAAEAAWFAKCIGGRLLSGEFVGLDLEVAKAGVNPVVWTGQWLDALAALGIGVRLLYLNKSELAGFDWSPIARRGVLLWLAAYDGAQTAAGVPVGAFGALTLKQYTSTGRVAGETGQVDVDWSPLSAAQLTAALTGATPSSTPTLTGASDVDLVSDPAGTVYLVTDTEVTATGDINLVNALVKARRLTVTPLSAVELALVQADAAARKARAEATLVGYGKRIERIDEGEHVAADGTVTKDPWGYGQRIEDTEAKVTALAAQGGPTPSLACLGSPKAVLTAIGQAAQSAATSTP